jgi:CheY-like chemotaxis protein
LTIINDILDFSKVESGKFDLDNRPFDVAMCVNDVAALLKPSSSRKNVYLSVELPQDLPKWYIGDVGRLRQILTNIVGNSVKFTDKGEVRIRLTSETDDGRNVLRFEIIDTGIGIPENKINDVFEKFSQVDNTSARRYEGTGLGLAICRTLVERMDGKIGLMSKVGVGSTFWFTLPLKPHILAPSAPNSSVSINALPVLLFEAEGGEYSPWLISLRNIGCNVDLVTSVEALPRVVMSKAGGGSAVVLFSIPVSSETLLRQVAELRARVGSNVAIVVCTSLGVTGDSKSLVAAGAQAYLSGELTDEQLRDVLTDVVSNLQSATHQLVTRHSITEHRASPESIDDGTGAIDLDRDTCEARSVLLVEDSMTNQEVARDFLESMGCLVDVAHNGKEAVEATQVTRYAIVLMDCQMPVMDGFQATRAIREHEEKNGTDRIPIIALTANAFESDKEKCAAAGMSDFLSKPFMPDEFETVVHKWMAVARRRIGRKKLDMLADA